MRMEFLVRTGRIYSKESVPGSALNCLNLLPDGVLTTHTGSKEPMVAYHLKLTPATIDDGSTSYFEGVKRNLVGDEGESG